MKNVNFILELWNKFELLEFFRFEKEKLFFYLNKMYRLLFLYYKTYTDSLWMIVVGFIDPWINFEKKEDK